MNIFKEQVNERKILLQNDSLDDIIHKFTCYLDEDIDNKLNEIKERPNDSKIVVIEQISYLKTQYLVVFFDKTIIIISISNITKLSFIFDKEKGITIVPISNTAKKTFLNSGLQADISDYEYDSNIEKFSNSFCILPTMNRAIINIWSLILPCFPTYFLYKSYNKLEQAKLEKIENSEIFSEEKLIEIQSLGGGSSSHVILAFHVELEQLFAVKIFLNAESDDKLYNRELRNYKKLWHPSLPRFYGETKIQGQKCIVIEYIRGKDLYKINKIPVLFEDKINFIFQIMSIIEYFQNKRMIYRDIKPDNFIIDSNNRLFIIDLDRLIGEDEQIVTKDITMDFTSKYHAPEILDGTLIKYSFKEDVYSLGKLVNFILIENKKDDELRHSIFLFDESFDVYSTLQNIFQGCTNEEPDKRPHITQLIDSFYENFLYKITIDQESLIKEDGKNNKFFPYWMLINEFDNDRFKKLLELFYNQSRIRNYIQIYSKYFNINHLISQYNLNSEYPENYFIQNIHIFIYYFQIAANQNQVDAQFYLGSIYYQGEYVLQDINTAIHFLLLAANQNYADAQYQLGVIYYEGKCISKDIDKAIHYLKLAADQNHESAMVLIGIIYSESQNIPGDIDKGIHYLTLAANQNNVTAQTYLGIIYSGGKHTTRDINKAIYYLTLAANQNNSSSQFLLGVICSKGTYVPRDSNKDIFYLTQAANQNHSDAQLSLALLYFQGEYVPRDINKSLHYLALSANLNNSYAQYNLGEIYYEGIYVSRDINKAILYLTLAADQYHSVAQYRLGFIYYEGKYVLQDINKAIYYFTLAANNNNSNAQFHLGFIYYEGIYVIQDINKAIYYFTLAANQNCENALYYLGSLYYEGKHVSQDIDKALHYFLLSSNQNHPLAQNILGFIYYKGEYVTRDINKSIHYFTLAANQNYTSAQNSLGTIYFEGKYISRDVNKAIHYLTLAANQNNPEAQFNLGCIYVENSFPYPYIRRGIYYITLASKNRLAKAHFPVGFLYHEGRYIEQDIQKAIYYYKEASSLNIQYAKNNLGVIYKNGFDNKIEPRLGSSIEYFKEAIQKKDDVLSMYNLSSIYLYEEGFDANLDDSIELLIKSSNLGFIQSNILLCFAIIKKSGFNIDDIIEEIDKYEDIDIAMKNLIIHIILEEQLTVRTIFDEMFEKYNINYLYDLHFDYITSTSIKPRYKTDAELAIKLPPSISSLFYQGFCIDI